MMRRGNFVFVHVYTNRSTDLSILPTHSDSYRASKNLHSTLSATFVDCKITYTTITTIADSGAEGERGDREGVIGIYGEDTLSRAVSNGKKENNNINNTPICRAA